MYVGEASKTEPKPNDGLNLPGGAKNWVTLAGLTRLQALLKHLHSVERLRVVEVVSWAIGNGGRSEIGD